MKWPGSKRKARCDYCDRSATVWAWYTGYMAYRGPYRPSGELPINAAACQEHEGCPNWESLLAMNPQARVEHLH